MVTHWDKYFDMKKYLYSETRYYFLIQVSQYSLLQLRIQERIKLLKLEIFRNEYLINVIIFFNDLLAREVLLPK